MSRLARLLAGVVSAVLLTGCAQAGLVEVRPAGPGYPLALQNCGRQVVIDAPPQRAVSLNQGSTEILLSLGLADRASFGGTLGTGGVADRDQFEQLGVPTGTGCRDARWRGGWRWSASTRRPTWTSPCATWCGSGGSRTALCSSVATTTPQWPWR